MSQFVHRMRYTMRRHPNALPIRSTRPAYVPSLLNFGERTLAELGPQAMLDGFERRLATA